MIQVVNKKFPYYWQLPVYVLWGPIGCVIILVAFLPESPWYHARKGNRDAAFKSLKTLYGDVDGFNLEEEYGIILRTLEHEKQVLAETVDVKWRDVFIGLNLVSPPLDSIGVVVEVFAAQNSHFDCFHRRRAARWTDHDRHLCYL